MITPTFKLDQNDEFLFVNIRAPYAKLSEVDVYVENNDFRFYCKPYYLRLNLPGNVIETDQSGIYDVDEGLFKFKLQKVNRGENFDGLELLTKLLTPAGQGNNPPANKPLIEELDKADNEGGIEGKENEGLDDDDDEDGNQWFIQQNLKDDEDLSNLLTVKYGFAQTKSNIFSKLSSEYTLVIDIPDPDHTRIDERKRLRIENENEKFEDDHYLADLFDNDYIESVLLKYKPDFGGNGDEEEEQDAEGFTQKEQDCLKQLPRKTFMLDKEQKFCAFAGLVDILFAYCYNNRVNCGEKNVESGWTIVKLSSTLSWFDTFKNFEEVVVASFRRSICFPLYRNWKLTKKVYKDLLKLLKMGRKTILKVLIKIRDCFIDGDCRYILNDLYINDYCVWIQYVSEKKLETLVECLEKINVSKEMVGFDLECVELAGKLAIEEENNSEEESGDEEHDFDEIDANDNVNKKTDSLVTKLANLELEETSQISKKESNPKIIELD